MPRYISDRTKRRIQTNLTEDRYKYLDETQTEPNLGNPNDPLTLPGGPRYQIVATLEEPGKRFWQPSEEGNDPGGMSIYDEVSLVGGADTTTQLFFKGLNIEAIGETAEQRGIPQNPGIAATVTFTPPAGNDRIIINDEGEFGISNSPYFVYNSNNVGLNIASPTAELHVNGDINLSGTIYFPNNSAGGNSNDVFVKTALGNLEWKSINSLQIQPKGELESIQYNANGQIIGGAVSFFYRNIDGGLVGIGTTRPEHRLHVFGQTGITSMNVSSGATFGTFDDSQNVIRFKNNTSEGADFHSGEMLRIKSGSEMKWPQGSSDAYLHIYYGSNTNESFFTVGDSTNPTSLIFGRSINPTAVFSSVVYEGGSSGLAPGNTGLGVSLYYNNNIKFKTKSTGVDIIGDLQSSKIKINNSGNITLGDDKRMRFGQYNNMILKHESSTTDNILHSTDSFTIKGNGGNKSFRLTGVGKTVEIYHSGNGEKVFELTDYGAKIDDTLYIISDHPNYNPNIPTYNIPEPGLYSVGISTFGKISISSTSDYNISNDQLSGVGIISSTEDLIIEGDDGNDAVIFGYYNAYDNEHDVIITPDDHPVGLKTASLVTAGDARVVKDVRVGGSVTVYGNLDSKSLTIDQNINVPIGIKIKSDNQFLYENVNILDNEFNKINFDSNVSARVTESGGVNNQTISISFDNLIDEKLHPGFTSKSNFSSKTRGIHDWSEIEYRATAILKKYGNTYGAWYNDAFGQTVALSGNGKILAIFEHGGRESIDYQNYLDNNQLSGSYPRPWHYPSDDYPGFHGPGYSANNDLKRGLVYIYERVGRGNYKFIDYVDSIKNREVHNDFPPSTSDQYKSHNYRFPIPPTTHDTYVGFRGNNRGLDGGMGIAKAGAHDRDFNTSGSDVGLFGISISLDEDGSTLAIGAPGWGGKSIAEGIINRFDVEKEYELHDNPGRVLIYRRDKSSGLYERRQILKGFSLSFDTLISNAPYTNSNPISPTSKYWYEDSGPYDDSSTRYDWAHERYWIGKDGSNDTGTNWDNYSNYFFGMRVSLSPNGKRIAISQLQNFHSTAGGGIYPRASANRYSNDLPWSEGDVVLTNPYPGVAQYPRPRGRSNVFIFEKEHDFFYPIARISDKAEIVPTVHNGQYAQGYYPMPSTVSDISLYGESMITNKDYSSPSSGAGSDFGLHNFHDCIALGSDLSWSGNGNTLVVGAAGYTRRDNARLSGRSSGETNKNGAVFIYDFREIPFPRALTMHSNSDSYRTPSDNQGSSFKNFVNQMNTVCYGIRSWPRYTFYNPIGDKVTANSVRWGNDTSVLNYLKNNNSVGNAAYRGGIGHEGYGATGPERPFANTNDPISPEYPVATGEFEVGSGIAFWTHDIISHRDIWHNSRPYQTDYAGNCVGVGVTRVQILQGTYNRYNGDNLGYCVDISDDGNTVISSALFDSWPGYDPTDEYAAANNNGLVYVWERGVVTDSWDDQRVVGVTTFSLKQILYIEEWEYVANTGSGTNALGSNRQDDDLDYLYGQSICISADSNTIAILSPFKPVNYIGNLGSFQSQNTKTGCVTVWRRLGKDYPYIRVQTFTGENSTTADSFGSTIYEANHQLSISADGNEIYVGNGRNNSVEVFEVTNQSNSTTCVSGSGGNIGVDEYDPQEALHLDGDLYLDNTNVEVTDYLSTSVLEYGSSDTYPITTISSSNYKGLTKVSSDTVLNHSTGRQYPYWQTEITGNFFNTGGTMKAFIKINNGSWYAWDASELLTGYTNDDMAQLMIDEFESQNMHTTHNVTLINSADNSGSIFIVSNNKNQNITVEVDNGQYVNSGDSERWKVYERVTVSQSTSRAPSGSGMIVDYTTKQTQYNQNGQSGSPGTLTVNHISSLKINNPGSGYSDGDIIYIDDPKCIAGFVYHSDRSTFFRTTTPNGRQFDTRVDNNGDVFQSWYS